MSPRATVPVISISFPQKLHLIMLTLSNDSREEFYEKEYKMASAAMELSVKSLPF
jgi:hypothetical protein